VASVVREWIRAHWPRLRLRTIVFATLFAVAAMPGVGAVFLRVYENTLVRQTEAELAAQGAALAAAAAALWPAAPPGRPAPAMAPATSTLDLSVTPISPERPRPALSAPPASDAITAGERLAPVLRETKAATLASILLLDRAGRIVDGVGASGTLAGLPEVASALGGAPATALRRNGAYRAVYRFEWLSRAAAIRVHFARPILVRGRVVGVLVLSRSARALFRGLYEDRGKIVLGVTVILALLVVLTGLLSRGVTRPIERLSAATRDVARGGGAVPEPPSTAAIEIQDLYLDFAAMSDAIERRSRYLRDVAHAISHEFKTPLAGIRGAVELLQDHGDDMSVGERRRFLANAAADARRLAGLIGRLLDLARADMMRPTPGDATTLPSVVARVADAYRTEGFDVEDALPPGIGPVALPSAVIETVLATLIDNSRRAGGTRATVTTVDAGAGPLVLRVVDDGPGIAATDAERIFDPFFTTRREDGGTGLGLTIARSLLAAYGGSIAVAASDGGAAFEMTLPFATQDCRSA